MQTIGQSAQDNNVTEIWNMEAGIDNREHREYGHIKTTDRIDTRAHTKTAGRIYICAIRQSPSSSIVTKRMKPVLNNYADFGGFSSWSNAHGRSAWI